MHPSSILKALKRLRIPPPIGWYLPLLFVLIPLWMAFRYTCIVPRADHWSMVIAPYVQWQDGASFLETIRIQVNDSRMEVPIAIHLALIKWTHWNLVLESLLAVGMWALTAWLLIRELRFLRASQGSWAALVPWLATIWLLSPRQWMNWTWGIQICYAMVVLATLATLVCLRSGAPRWLRVLGAAFCAFIAVHTFINGWFAWILGFGWLLWEALVLRKEERGAWGAVGVWIFLAALSGWDCFQGYHPGAGGSGGGMMKQLFASPGIVLRYFLQVMGAPFSDFWPTIDRGEIRLGINVLGSMVIAVVSLVLMAILFWGGRQGDWKGHSWAVSFWWLCAAWGVGNGFAIALARTGVAASNPFESRYPAYTLWFYFALIGLCCYARAPWVKKIRWVWLAGILWCSLISGFQALRDARLDFDRNRMIVTAAAVRNVAPEIPFLHILGSCPVEYTIQMLNRLDGKGLLQIKSLEASSPGKAPAWDRAVGEIQQGGTSSNSFYIKGWGMDKDTRDSLDGILVSMQPSGGVESWLGVAQRRSYRTKLAKTKKSIALHNRIGWDYSYAFTGDHPDQDLSGIIKLPSGKVTFRAYGYNIASGGIQRLEGEVTLDLPVSLPNQASKP